MQSRIEDRILRPGTLLRDNQLPVAADAVASARAQDLPTNWERAVDAQREVLDAMLAIRKHLAKSEDWRQAIALLRDVIEGQKALKRDVKTESESEIEGLFND